MDIPEGISNSQYILATLSRLKRILMKTHNTELIKRKLSLSRLDVQY
jgi:hypothetical protein